MGAVIGIDLGTTNSCAAIVRDGRPRVISDTGGAVTIPSIVAIDEKGNRLVGQAAKRQTMINPKNTIYGAKRLIGRHYHSKILDSIQQHFTYEMSEGDNDDVLIKLAGEVYGLDEVSALILDKIRNIAQDILEEEVTAAVVTVPAYFSDRQRQAVKDAGKIAELEVLRIINEPTAAALAYGWQKHLQEQVVIYDLGGGTFDLSILEVRDNVYEVKATGGDTFLGGVDFDNRLIDHIMTEFQKTSGVDLSGDAISLQRVRDAAERAKIDLSTKTDARLLIPFIAMSDNGPVNLDITVTREQFNNMVSDLTDRTLMIVDEVFKDAHLGKDQINDVLLVGGMTRMPYVQQRVEEYFGKPPSKNVHPDEAVAIGAAIMAYSLTESADYKITLIDVLPMSIGVALAKNRFHRIFARNASIPNATSIVFTTSKDNQTQLKLKIFQGENDNASNNELLGEFLFSGIRPAPKGEARIEVILRLSPEGILKVEAQDPDTKQWVETTIKVTSGITQKTHKTSLIEHHEPLPQKAKEPAKKFKEPTQPSFLGKPSPPSRPAVKDPTPPPKPRAPTPPPAPPSPPPARPQAKKAPTPPATPAATSTPTASPPQEPPAVQAIAGVQTKTTQGGRIVMRRDPITGQILKDEASAEGAQDKSKQQFKRYTAPPKPPSTGEKASSFFKNLIEKISDKFKSLKK